MSTAPNIIVVSTKIHSQIKKMAAEEGLTMVAMAHKILTKALEAEK